MVPPQPCLPRCRCDEMHLAGAGCIPQAREVAMAIRQGALQCLVLVGRLQSQAMPVCEQRRASPSHTRNPELLRFLR